MLVGVLVMAGSLVYVWYHQEDFRASVLTQLMDDFKARQDVMVAALPPEVTLNQSDAWDFSFIGDELHIKAPELKQKTGEAPLAEQFEASRNQLALALHAWLTKRPRDEVRFPIRIRFNNEP